MSSANRKTQVKLKDVASEAEVSVATVSLALRNDPSISHDTRRRVLEAQKRLGYRPIRNRSTSSSSNARNSVSRSRTILYCVVGFPVTKIQYSDFLEGVMGACEERKIKLELKSFDVASASVSAPVSDFAADGVILTGDLNQESLEYFLKSHPKVVVLGNYSFFNVDRVEFDVFGIGEMIAENLVARGHKHVAHILRDPKNYFERQFLMGIRDGLEVHGLKLADSQVFRADNLFGSITKVAAQILESTPTPTAITCDASNVAEACLTEMRLHQARNNREVPEIYSMAISKYDRAPAGVHLLNLGLERCGWLAVERLCQIFDTSSPFPFSSVVQPTGWSTLEIR